MNRMPYEVDFINNKIILTKKFYKAASILNSSEYNIMIQLRTQNPGFEIVLKEIKKKEGKKSYRNLTYANMREYIITREGEKSETVAEFDRVMALSKIQAGPYAYVKTWFLKKYGEEFNDEEEVSEDPNLQLVK